MIKGFKSMKPILNNYSLKNKKLKRLGFRVRLEIVLYGQISKETIEKIEKIIGCDECKWQTKDGIVYGVKVDACRKLNVKYKKTAFLLLAVGKANEGKDMRLAIPYCVDFEEKKN
jgi:hypothetical protein